MAGPPGRRQSRHQIVADETLQALVREGLTRPQIAARVGLSRSGLNWRLDALRRRGLLPAGGIRAHSQRRFGNEDLLALVRAGHRRAEIARRLGVSLPAVQVRLRQLRQQGFLPPVAIRRLNISNRQLLALRRAGLWNTEIAARTGMTLGAVQQRFLVLRRRGVQMPPPAGPRPNAMRRASDQAILSLTRERLRPREIAARVGISQSSVMKRLASLRRRGLLRRDWLRGPEERARQERNRQILALWEEGLWPRQIADRLELRPPLVRLVVSRMRRRGLAPARPAGARWKPRPRMTDEDLLGARGQGLSNVAIAVRFGLTRSTVKVRLWELRKRGVPVPPLPPRPGHEARRRVSDDALLVHVKMGWRVVRIAARVGLPEWTVRRRIGSLRARGLLPAPPPPKITDPALLVLCGEGLWPREIAARTGVSVSAVQWRLRKLRKQGVAVPRPRRPAPNASQRVSDEQILEGLREGLTPPQIAAQAGLVPRSVYARILSMRRRGMLRGKRPRPPIPLP